MSEQLDMQDLFSNINNRSEVETIYKELCKLSHPDKFDKEPVKKEIAHELFAQIQKNRSNYTQLMKLKHIIEVKLLNN